MKLRKELDEHGVLLLRWEAGDGGERVLQLTPPGSPGSIHFGTNLTSAAPGSVQRVVLVVSDIETARDDLVRRGVDVSEVFHYAAGPAPFGGRVRGVAPDQLSYGSYATFSDPDGNGWLLQEVTTRLPGRVAGDTTTYASARDLAQALRRARVRTFSQAFLAARSIWASRT